MAVRRILNDLRPGVLDHLGLWAALEWLLEDLQSRSALQCTFDCTEEIERCRLGREAETAIYRIAQEVLTNITLMNLHKCYYSVSRSVNQHTNCVQSYVNARLCDEGHGRGCASVPVVSGPGRS